MYRAQPGRYLIVMLPFRGTLPAAKGTYEHQAQNDLGHIMIITIRLEFKISAKLTNSSRRGYERRWLWWTCE